MSNLANYSRSVFINCPFDSNFKPLFEALVFTIIACKFIPRCALEQDDSNDIRIHKIIKLIKECQYGIHDLSLEEPRFNMPLELGIFMGCMDFGSREQKKKRYLILEAEPHQSKRFISDLSGQDVKAHKNEVALIIRGIRDWLSNKIHDKLPHGSPLFAKYERFREDLPELCKSSDWLVEELSFKEYVSLATTWLRFQEIDPSVNEDEKQDILDN